MIDWFSNIRERAIALLSGQFDRSENLQAVIRISAGQMQQIEDATRELVELRSISTGFGQQLDRIGEWVGQPRNGQDDETYRDFLRFRIFINISDGEPEVILTVLRRLTEGTDLEYWENHPAAYQLFTDGGRITSDLKDIIQGVTAGGVGSVPITFSLGDPYPFRLSRTPEPVPLLLDDLSLFIDDALSPLLITSRADAVGIEGGRISEIYRPVFLLDDDEPFSDDGGELLLIAGPDLQITYNAPESHRIVEVMHLG